jgi:hypothetical protein
MSVAWNVCFLVGLLHSRTLDLIRKRLGKGLKMAPCCSGRRDSFLLIIGCDTSRKGRSKF